MGFIGDLFGGGKSSQPTQQTVVQATPQFAPEQKPYIERAFKEAQNIFEQRQAEGFQPFPGPQLAPLSAQERESMAGITELARGPGPAADFNLARQASIASGAPIGTADISRLMSPYQQAVTDIAKREAIRQYQMGPLQEIASRAVTEGGLRGSRRAIIEAEGQRNLQQQLGDIQARGLESAYDRALQQAAAERGRLAAMAAQLPQLGTAQYQQQLAQLGQIGGVGETRRAQEQAAIDLARQQYELERTFPEQALTQFIGFLRGVPAPTGQTQTTTAPAPAKPSGLSSLMGLAGGVGTLLGGLGKVGFQLNQGGRVGGLSTVVRRNRGGQVIRMNEGGLFGDRARAMVRQFGDPPQNVYPETARRISATMPDADMYGEFTREMPTLGDITPLKPPKPKEVVVEEVVETQPSPQTDEPESEKSLAERFAEYQKLMKGDDVESELSWPERLQLAAAFFGAGAQPTTGDFLADLAQFGEFAGTGASKVYSARAARELAADKRRIQSIKDFRTFIKEEQLRPLEIEKLAADLGYTQAQTNKLISEYTNPEVASPSEIDIAGAISYLDYMGIPVRETSKEKGQYGKAGSAYQLAQVAKSLKTSADNALRIAKERGAVAQDPDGRLIIDVDKAIRGGPRRVDQSVRGVTRGADGKLVAKAEGGMVGEKPVLRYPEDFS